MPSASPTGGAEEALVQLIRSEAAASVAWQLAFLEDGPLVKDLGEHAAESFVVPCGRTREVGKWWRAAGRISREASRFNSSLILGWMTKGHVYGGLAAWRAGLPAAWFQMGLPEDGLLDRVSRRLPAKAVFCCSGFVVREQLARQPGANAVAIPLGVDLSRFDLSKLPSPSEARAQLGLPAAGPLIGIVGRLQRWKGMHTLIAAMPEVLARHPDAHAVIVGGEYPTEPNYARDLRQQVRTLGLEAKVTFAGGQKNVPLWMQAMDVFVHASEREPFGIVVVEAMSLGKPVIAAVPGGPEEIIGGAADGLLTPSGDAPSLSDGIRRILSEGCGGERVGSNARSRAVSNFSAESFAQRCVSAARELSS